MKESPLFRKDQYSYLLYPNKKLPGFLQKNLIPASAAADSELIRKLVADGNRQIVDQDMLGGLHFNGNFRNAADLQRALDGMASGRYGNSWPKSVPFLEELFEKVFPHKAFTGRSGTFMPLRGLGSIYWHMVSKLLLAVRNAAFRLSPKTLPRLSPAGSSTIITKSKPASASTNHPPSALFPPTPIPTPGHRGAQQPGGSRTGERGYPLPLRRTRGLRRRGPTLFLSAPAPQEEFLTEPRAFYYISARAKRADQPPQGELAFTFCQVPVVYASADRGKDHRPLRRRKDRGSGRPLPSPAFECPDL